ncbi:putative protein prenylyltransferase [Golovinomyces cichoracearum]|uniref:Protein prenyltransferase alpha subunit repeat-containing protein 1-B n=1 Tax=Golovinomyces cichoracearum TaxID=62708 RepID=A0A420HGU9_9PEZI|nr:putative protein prenylyltransferase [Golovinomyces cichoracearum]
MSRAISLDLGNLSEKNLNSSFNEISLALKSKSNTKLEIEILGKSHISTSGESVIRDGSFIAIPKTILLQAFIVARLVLFKYVRECPSDREHSLTDATAIILLVDSEHLTAANTRKRLLKKSIERNQDIAQEVFAAEICWVDGYLTSHLYRHTKSPTLWAHRRWVIEQNKLFVSAKYMMQNLNDVIFIAAQRHPRNYYAWSHARWLQSLNTVVPKGMPELSISKSIISAVQDWCLRNPSDTSGFSFLLYCLMTTPDLEECALSVFTKTFRTAISYRWSQESIWCFLRTLATWKLRGEENFVCDEDSIADYPLIRNRICTARKWCRIYHLKMPELP